MYGTVPKIFWCVAELGKGPHQADILGRLDPAPLNNILQRYEEYLRNAATRVAADQGIINREGERDNCNFIQFYIQYTVYIFKSWFGGGD